MIKPVYVTDVAERKPKYVGGISVSIDLWGENGVEAWWKQISDETDFTFPNMRSEGMRAYYRLLEAIKSRDEQTAREVFKEMKKHTIRSYKDKSDVEKWEHMAVQMPRDIGGPRKKEIRDILTHRARGKVLETMCGFNSYFDDSPNISEVIVLDFCRGMLERYAFHQRTRILYDLERVTNGKKMDFFSNGEFQTVGCWGSNYLTNPAKVFSEFSRILSPGGKLLILESTTEGYSDLVKRYFKPEDCAKSMREAGFSPNIVYLKDIKTKWEIGKYFLVEGIKADFRKYIFFNMFCVNKQL